MDATPDRRIVWSAGETPPTAPAVEWAPTGPVWERWAEARVLTSESELRVITGVPVWPDGQQPEVESSAGRRAAIVRGEDEVLVSGDIRALPEGSNSVFHASTTPGGIVSALPRATVTVRVFAAVGSFEATPDVDPVTGDRFLALTTPDVHGLHALGEDGSVLAVISAR